MEETQTNPQNQSGNEAKLGLTPHELYNHHILHPDEPITDDDIRSLKIDSGGVFKDHQLTKEETTASNVNEEESKERARIEEEEATDNEKPKASPYDILGG